LAKGLVVRKSDTAFLVPDLFAESKIVGGKGGEFSLDLVTGRIEVAEEFQHQGVADLVGGH